MSPRPRTRTRLELCLRPAPSSAHPHFPPSLVPSSCVAPFPPPRRSPPFRRDAFLHGRTPPSHQVYSRFGWWCLCLVRGGRWCLVAAFPPARPHRDRPAGRGTRETRARGGRGTGLSDVLKVFEAPTDIWHGPTDIQRILTARSSPILSLKVLVEVDFNNAA